MKIPLLSLVLAVLSQSVPVLLAEVSLAPLFRDGAILQQGKPLPVWGRAAAGEKVTVEFSGQRRSVQADADGRWSIMLEPLPLSRQSAEMVVTGGNVVRIADILVGEVWICSGQSNMEWPVKAAADPEREIAAASHSLIRQIKIPRTVAEAPADTVAGEWTVCSPKTVGDFTAVGYFFGRTLLRELDVPIGLINTSWGGTQIESWISPEGLKSESAFSTVFERWKQLLADFPAADEKYRAALAKYEKAKAEAEAAGREFQRRPPRPAEGPGSRWMPAGLYNAMVHPLVPYAIRGVIWYQGESNAARFPEYALLFQTLISQWRKVFGQGDLPFLFVQLANLERAKDSSGVQWAFLREAQASVLSLPATGMATAVDIGDPTNIHPKNKQEVGRRLALIALASVYEKGGDYSGPIFQSAKADGSAMRITFGHAKGLTLLGDPPSGFELAGADKVFHPATAKIEGDTVIAISRDVKKPVAVRYAWQNNPPSRLYNAAGLPAPPFRSDDWPAPASALETAP